MPSAAPARSGRALDWVRYGIRLPKIMIDECLLMIIVVGMGLTVAYLRAEYVLHRGFKADEQEKLSVRHELAANRLKPKQMDAPVAALQIRQRCLGKRSRFARGAAHRLLAAVFAAAALIGCHGGFGGCLLCGPVPRVQDNLEGTLSGLVGSGLTLQNNGAAGFQLNGSTANGTSVVFAVVLFNTAYDLTVQTQPTNPSQTCVVANGTGMAGTSDVTNISVTCTTNPPRFAYVTNRGSNNVSAYSVDAATGALTAIAGSPFPAGTFPVAIAIDQTGHFAYVVNQTDATISAFTIDRTSGALMAVAGSPFTTGASPTAVAIDPSTSFVYVTNGNANTVSAFAITAGSGALTAVTGSPFATGASPDSVAVEPLGNGVLVANESDGTVSVFSINDGALSASGSPFPAGNSPRGLSIDPSGQYVYLANGTSNTLSVFSSATAIAGSPYSTGSMPVSVAIDPLDNYVYVANQGSNNISAYALSAATGALTVVAGSPFAAGTQPSSVAVDPTGMFTYVTNSGADSVSVYSIDATTGALTLINGSVVSTGTQPTAIAISD